MQIKRLLPINTNFFIKNIRNILFQESYKLIQENCKRYFLLDAASYNNLGDQAIAYAISCFIKDNFGANSLVSINEREVIGYLRSLQKIIKLTDVIILSGGGNMGDLYPRYEALRRLIIKKFPNNKIIIFPQTIDYTNDKYGRRELKKSADIYSKHKFLTVCARESKSYDIMKSIYPNVLLVPDIVLYLYGKLEVEDISRSNTVGICLREDKESVISGQLRREILETAQSNFENIVYLSTMGQSSSAITTDSQRYDAIKSKLKEFSECRLIITDRLHGMIFSVLAGVPCIAIDNSNKKVSGVYETASLKQFGVRMLSSINKKLLVALFNELTDDNLDINLNTSTIDQYKELMRIL